MAENLGLKLGGQGGSSKVTKVSLGVQNVYVASSGTQTRTYNVANALPKYYDKLTADNFSATIRGGNPQYAVKGFVSTVEPPTFAYNPSTGILSVSVYVAYNNGSGADRVYWQMYAYCHYVA